MSVKNGWQRTAKRGWIPLVLMLSGVMPGAGRTAAEAAPVGMNSQPIVSADLAQDQVWYDLMDWLIDLLMQRLNCGSPSLPHDIPVAMQMVVDCYSAGGLAPMTLQDQAEFIRTIDETQRAMESAPDTIPLLTRLQFSTTLKIMRGEAELLP